MAGQGGVGGGFEGREDVLVLSFDVLLNGFEVLSGKFMWEAEEGLILFQRVSLAGFQMLRALGAYQEQVAFCVEFCGCEFGGHGE